MEQQEGGTVYDENRAFLDLLMNGFSLKRTDITKPNLYIYPVSFDEKHKTLNNFCIVNQLEIQGLNKRIPDAIVYVNGLPVVVLEFKNAIKDRESFSAPPSLARGFQPRDHRMAALFPQITSAFQAGR
jgi:type I restriction enzyme R subunit